MTRSPRNRARAIALAHPVPLTFGVRAWLVAGAVALAVAQIVLGVG
jgi:hypothetical protein